MFKIGIFIKIMIYHILFFSLSNLGGLIVAIFEGWKFSSNMLFLGCSNFFEIFQNIQALIFMSMMVIYFMFPLKIMSRIEIIVPITAIITRSMIIAIRYAYMSKTRYSVMKRKQNFEWIKQDLILASWQKITFQSINTEIEATKYRVKYERSDFSFNFLTPIDHDFQQRLSDSGYYKNLEIADVLKLAKK